MASFNDCITIKEVKKGKMNQCENKSEYLHVDRWNEGIENHEKLKKLLPFMNEDEGYL